MSERREHLIDHPETLRRLETIEGDIKGYVSTQTQMQIELTRQGVKLDALYGNGSGRIGAVERLDKKISRIGDKVVYASGGLAATIILVGWYLAHAKH